MINLRLKEERERLCLTQPMFAEAAGAKKRTLIDWEKGISSPTAVQLSALAEVGVDVVYVLTGQRSQTTESNPRLAALVDNLDNMAEEDRRCIERLADSLSQQSRALKAVKNQ